MGIRQSRAAGWSTNVAVKPIPTEALAPCVRQRTCGGSAQAPVVDLLKRIVQIRLAFAAKRLETSQLLMPDCFANRMHLQHCFSFGRCTEHFMSSCGVDRDWCWW
jgi:hypothetical protein